MEEISTISGKEVKPGVSMCVSECVYIHVYTYVYILEAIFILKSVFE